MEGDRPDLIWLLTGVDGRCGNVEPLIFRLVPVSSSTRSLLPGAWSLPPPIQISTLPPLRECGAVNIQAGACLLLYPLVAAWGLESAPSDSGFCASPRRRIYKKANDETTRTSHEFSLTFA
ncbi:hypothetical protein NDU88_004979 [Pleurodeles waltl]|uniref:Uncharacterized protein n=1 Tax=Pleurodeles waltl TaxID=8319 RepID=A0AAV7M7W6_PLEWA|nr:hypothetical protein NDU88_004979 [Pleurodeles waltl]